MDSSTEWTRDGLVAEVTRRLEGESRSTDERVSPTPNSRTIRYYTTLGLLDGPTGHRGRQALYGPAHVERLATLPTETVR